jgi:cellulose synthase operon protein C
MLSPLAPTMVRAQDAVTIAQSQDESRIDEAFRLVAGFYERGQWAESAQSLEAFVLNFPEAAQTKIAYYFLGESHLQLDQLTEARSAYQTFVLENQGHPLHERAVFRVAEIMHRTDNPHTSRMLDAFLAAFPKSEWREYALLYSGSRALAKGEHAVALKTFENALQEFPLGQLSSEFRFGLASSMLETGEIAEATRFFEMLLNDSNEMIRDKAKMKIAAIRVSQGKDAEAQLMLEELSQTKPADGRNRGEARFLLARTQMNKRDWVAAEREIEQAIAEGLDDSLAAAALHDSAIIAFELKEMTKVESATRELMRRFDDIDFGESACRMLLQSLFTQQKYDEILATFEAPKDGIRKDWLTDPVATEIFGRALYAAQKYDRSAEVFNKLLLENSKASAEQQNAWRYFFAASLLGIGKSAEARAELAKVDQNSIPDQFRASWNLVFGIAEETLENWPAARERFEACLAANPTESEVARARDGLLTTLVRLEMTDEALRKIEQYSTGNGWNPTPTRLQQLADFAFKSKDYATAEHCYNELVKQSKERGQVAAGLAGIGWIAFEKSDFVRAVMYFEQLLTNHSDYSGLSDIHLAMAKISEQTGDWAGAARYFRLVAESKLDPQIRQLAKYKQAVALRKTNGVTELAAAKRVLQGLIKEREENYPREYALYELSWLEQSGGNLDRATALLEEIVDRYSESVLWPDTALRVAQVRFSAGRYDEATSLINQLLSRELVPEVKLRTTFLQGQIAAKEQRWSDVESAMSTIANAETEASLRFQASYWLAESSYQRQDFPTALIRFEQVARQATAASPLLDPWINLRLGQCSAHQGNWKAAYELAIEGQKKYPQFELNYEFRFLQGRAEFAKGDLNLALDSFRSVVANPAAAKQETAAQSQWRIGETLLLQEKYAEAIAAYYRVDSLYDFPHWRAAAMLQAGKCQEKLRNYRQAMILYNNLVRKFPNSEFADQARIRLTALERQVNNETADPRRLR